MRTNSKAVRSQIIAHILDCVTDYKEQPFNSIEEAANHVMAEFDRVANHPYNLKKIPNNQERFSDYLCGLPFSFHYYSDDIEAFLNGLGTNPTGKKYSNDKMLHTYHHLIYSEILKAVEATK